MSYSDYGAFAFSWKQTGKKWVRDKNLEDTTLLGGKTSETILHDTFGLKMDMVLYSNKLKEQHQELSDVEKWNYYESHHAVLGQYEGMAILCYKEPIKVLWNGEVISTTNWETPPGPFREIIREDWVCRIQKMEGYTAAIIIYPNGDRQAAFVGFGLGDGHYWQDEEGYELDIDIQTGYPKGRNKEGKQYPREAYFLDILNNL